MKETLGDRCDIARLYDVRLEEAPFYLELEYTKSGDLASWAVNKGGIKNVPLQTRLELVAQIADCLGAANSIGIIHKDIKPTNILIEEREDGSVQTKLTDFGIGELVEREPLKDLDIAGSGFTTHATTLKTQHLRHSGTHLYFAPELHAGKEPSIQTDVFALGVLCYQVVAGDLELPLGHGWQRRIEDPLLVEDVAACVDVDPEQRLGNADELAKRLRDLEKRHRQREADRKTKKTAERHLRNRKVFLVSGAVGIAVLAFTSWVAVREAQHATRETQRAEELDRAHAELEWQFYVSSIQSVDDMIKGAQFDRARDILANCPEIQRHWEWGWLQYLCNPDVSMFEGHTDQVGNVRFSPDGKWLASSSLDGSVRL
jgi:eukaryotic-like serine/threonine-protein kinase